MQTERPQLIEARHPSGGVLFAAVGPAHFAKPDIAEFRFPALATPFPTKQAALAALKEAGASPAGEKK